MGDNHHSEGCAGSSAIGGPLGGERAAVTPPIDAVFDLLADDTRREICLYLVDLEREVVTIDDLVQGIAEAESEDEQDRLAADLHHCHLPELSSAGIIDYDARSNTLRYWGQPTVEKWARHVRVVDD